MRISLYLQRLAFTVAVLAPLLLALINEPIVYYVTGYAWLIGGGSFVWNRLMVEK